MQIEQIGIVDEFFRAHSNGVSKAIIYIKDLTLSLKPGDRLFILRKEDDKIPKEQE